MLEQKVIHACPTPVVPDVAAEYRWTCPDCGSKWRYAWGTRYDRTDTTGMLWWRKSEVVHVVNPGQWFRETVVTDWEQVD